MDIDEGKVYGVNGFSEANQDSVPRWTGESEATRHYFRRETPKGNYLSKNRPPLQVTLTEFIIIIVLIFSCLQAN